MWKDNHRPPPPRCRHSLTLILPCHPSSCNFGLVDHICHNYAFMHAANTPVVAADISVAANCAAITLTTSKMTSISGLLLMRGQTGRCHLGIPSFGGGNSDNHDHVCCRTSPRVVTPKSGTHFSPSHHAPVQPPTLRPPAPAADLPPWPAPRVWRCSCSLAQDDFLRRLSGSLLRPAPSMLAECLPAVIAPLPPWAPPCQRFHQKSNSRH